MVKCNKQLCKKNETGDFEWYVKKEEPLRLHHFDSRAVNSGDWKKPNIAEKETSNFT